MKKVVILKKNEDLETVEEFKLLYPDRYTNDEILRLIGLFSKGILEYKKYHLFVEFESDNLAYVVEAKENGYDIIDLSETL